MYKHIVGHGQYPTKANKVMKSWPRLAEWLLNTPENTRTLAMNAADTRTFRMVRCGTGP